MSKQQPAAYASSRRRAHPQQSYAVAGGRPQQSPRSLQGGCWLVIGVSPVIRQNSAETNKHMHNITTTIRFGCIHSMVCQKKVILDVRYIYVHVFFMCCV